eukprot:1703934-Amphidinium_carterae.1
MISGRQAIVVCDLLDELNTEAVLRKCCQKLGVNFIGSMCLVRGNDVVPAGARVSDWPGIRFGEINEYQLVVQQS